MDINNLLDLLIDAGAEFDIENFHIKDQLSEIGISLTEGDKNVRGIERKSPCSKLGT